ncbi:MAG: tetratricopeptide repeat protein [Magnetococcales bacterium]|nr:tetratricopeptide repeat protein [Magnetococcales bacterium]
MSDTIDPVDATETSKLEENLWAARMDRMDAMIQGAMMKRQAMVALETAIPVASSERMGEATDSVYRALMEKQVSLAAGDMEEQLDEEGGTNEAGGSDEKVWAGAEGTDEEDWADEEGTDEEDRADREERTIEEGGADEVILQNLAVSRIPDATGVASTKTANRLAHTATMRVQEKSEPGNSLENGGGDNEKLELRLLPRSHLQSGSKVEDSAPFVIRGPDGGRGEAVETQNRQSSDVEGGDQEFGYGGEVALPHRSRDIHAEPTPMELFQIMSHKRQVGVTQSLQSSLEMGTTSVRWSEGAALRFAGDDPLLETVEDIVPASASGLPDFPHSGHIEQPLAVRTMPPDQNTMGRLLSLFGQSRQQETRVASQDVHNREVRQPEVAPVVSLMPRVENREVRQPEVESVVSSILAKDNRSMALPENEGGAPAPLGTADELVVVEKNRLSRALHDFRNHRQAMMVASEVKTPGLIPGSVSSGQALSRLLVEEEILDDPFVATEGEDATNAGDWNDSRELSEMLSGGALEAGEAVGVFEDAVAVDSLEEMAGIEVLGDAEAFGTLDDNESVGVFEDTVAVVFPEEMAGIEELDDAEAFGTLDDNESVGVFEDTVAVDSLEEMAGIEELEDAEAFGTLDDNEVVGVFEDTVAVDSSEEMAGIEELEDAEAFGTLESSEADDALEEVIEVGARDDSGESGVLAEMEGVGVWEDTELTVGMETKVTPSVPDAYQRHHEETVSELMANMTLEEEREGVRGEEPDLPIPAVTRGRRRFSQKRLPEGFFTQDIRDSQGAEKGGLVAGGYGAKPLVRVHRLDELHFAWRSLVRMFGSFSESLVRKYLAWTSLDGNAWTEYYLTRGRRSLALGRVHDAVLYFGRALEKNEDNAAILAALGRCHITLGSFEQALNYLEKAKERDQAGGAWLDADLIVAYSGCQLFDQAERLLRHGLDADRSASSDRSALWFQLAELLARQERHAEAVEAYREAVALKPTRRDYQRALGFALQMVGQSKEAVAHLKMAESVDDRELTPGNLG